MNANTPRTRRILLVDCDQFFVQCARIADPEGAGREPLLLVGGTPAQRGVVTSASYETRAFGCRSGMPTAQALRLCPRAKVVPVPRSLCGEKSRAVRAVLRRYSPVVEAASIDEAYVDLTGTEALYGGESLADTARRLQAEVKAETDIVVSAGGGTNKMVAKLAVGRAKPAGVHVVAPGGEASFMAQLELKVIPGVGPVFQEALRRYGLVTVADVLPLDEATLAGLLGEGRAAWLHRRVRGLDDAVVEPDSETKSISRDETFPRDLHRDEDLERELLALVVRLGGDLRESGLRARTVTVRIRDADFRNRSASRTLDQALESDRAIYAVGRELLARLRVRRRTPARLLSIAVSNFTEAEGATQLALFQAAAPDLETERDRNLSRAVDELRARFGKDALLPGRLLDD
ncbi:MAG TPA: DNA polymerase IV [Longimicrobiales bacterium]|nr:DNA polymerase IV [Longimicrobiales bacterium]